MLDLDSSKQGNSPCISPGMRLHQARFDSKNLLIDSGNIVVSSSNGSLQIKKKDRLIKLKDTNKKPEKSQFERATVSSAVSFAPVINFGKNQVQYNKPFDLESHQGLKEKNPTNDVRDFINLLTP